MRAFSREPAINDMSDSEFESFLSQRNRTNSRLDRLSGLGGNSSSEFGGRTSSTGSGSGSSSSSNSTSSNLGGIGGLGDIDSLTNRAKDLARFRLGLDKEQAETSFGLRDREAEGNFGRQFRLDTNQREFDRNINRDTQGAMTERLDRELTNRLQQQDRGINQENFATGRAIRLASRRLGA